MTADLSTSYLGLELRSPIVASAGPLTGELDTARRIADAGAAAIVLPSLFEEEILERRSNSIVHSRLAVSSSPRRSTTFRKSPGSPPPASGTSRSWP